MSGVRLYFVGYSAANGSLRTPNGQNGTQYMTRRKRPSEGPKPPLLRGLLIPPPHRPSN